MPTNINSYCPSNIIVIGNNNFLSKCFASSTRFSLKEQVHDKNSLTWNGKEWIYGKGAQMKFPTQKLVFFPKF